MDLEFSLAQKRREKERIERIEKAEKKRNEEEKRKQTAIIERARIDKLAEERRQKEVAQREKEELERLKEEQLTGGIRYCKTLRAVPIATDGERVTLPPSALDSLEAQSAIDPSRPLTFELSVIDENSNEVISRTFVGVLEFTASENEVGVPPKTALSLTRERGGGLDKLRVKYVKLPVPVKSFVRFQPKGEGFHTAGQEVVSLDLKSVLERELSRHTAISKGDWLPIRHNKASYTFVVVSLEPHDAFSLVNTDLEVDLLPSEHAMHEQEKRARAEEATAAAVVAATQAAANRVARAETVRKSLPEEPVDSKDTVVILVRLPQGGQSSRRFLRSDNLASVFLWVGSLELVVDRGIVEKAVALAMNYPKRCFTSDDAELSLSEAGLTGRREALFLQENATEEAHEVSATPMELDEPEVVDQEVSLSQEWASAAELQKTKLDRQLSDEGRAAATQEEEAVSKPQGDKVGIFHMLVADGVDKVVAASAAQSFGDSLQELADMGFQNHTLNIKLLERYNGRMLRVVNALSERPSESTAQVDVPLPTEPSSVVVPPPQPQAQQSFQEKFAELVASGVTPNEAAAQALLFMQEAPQQLPTVIPTTHIKWKNELSELAAMGFTDEGRNIELLERYQGRLVRVVNALTDEN